MHRRPGAVSGNCSACRQMCFPILAEELSAKALDGHALVQQRDTFNTGFPISRMSLFKFLREGPPDDSSVTRDVGD